MRPETRRHPQRTAPCQRWAENAARMAQGNDVAESLFVHIAYDLASDLRVSHMMTLLYRVPCSAALTPRQLQRQWETLYK